MVQINTTTMSSKGQIVIPQNIRQGLVEGEKFVIIKNGQQIILKKMDDFDKNLEEDLEFAKRTEEAWKRIENGEGISMEFDDFIQEMKKW